MEKNEILYVNFLKSNLKLSMISWDINSLYMGNKLSISDWLLPNANEAEDLIQMKCEHSSGYGNLFVLEKFQKRF